MKTVVTMLVVGTLLVTGGIPLLASAGGLPVQVVNPPTKPVPVSIANSKEPVALSASCDTSGNFAGCVDSDFYVVPPGKRLVVEYFSCSGQLVTGQGLTCRILRSGSTAAVYLPTSSLSPGDGFLISAGQEVRLYASGDEKISASAHTPGSLDGVVVSFSLIGYLENAP